jgi:hypothetical protein
VFQPCEGWRALALLFSSRAVTAVAETSVEESSPPYLVLSESHARKRQLAREVLWSERILTPSRWSHTPSPSILLPHPPFHAAYPVYKDLDMQGFTGQTQAQVWSQLYTGYT